MYIQSNSRCQKALTKPYRQLSAVPNLALLAREIPKISGPRASNTLNPDKDKAIFGASNPPKSGHTFRGALGDLLIIIRQPAALCPLTLLFHVQAEKRQPADC